MKVIVVLLLLIGVGIAGVYYLGGYKSFDPDQQGRAAKAAIAPGMNWKKVVSVAGDNPRLQTIGISKRKIGGRMVEERLIGPMVDFSVNKVSNKLSSGGYKDGFILHYMFSEQVCFDVEFDNTGTAVEVRDAATMADLLGTRQH